MSENQNQKIRTNNDKLIIGVIVGSVLGFLIYWSIDVISVHSEIVFLILIVIAVLFAIIFLAFTWFRNRIIKRFFGKDIEFNTILSDTQETLSLISEYTAKTLPIEQERKEKIKLFAPKLINYILWSNFRNWGLRIFTSFILGLGGIVTTILILNQNKLFENQNKRIEQQTHLIEADRRSAQIFIMGEVLSDLNRELEDSTNTNRKLTKTLAGRIIGLSKAMKPYYYLEADSLVTKPLSPERGQFLLALLQSDIDEETLGRNIFQKSDFSYSDMRKSILYDFENNKEFFLRAIKLSNANFTDAMLQFVDLRNSTLNNTIFRGVVLSHADLKYSRVFNADFSNASIWYTDFRDTKGFGQIKSLDSAKVSRYDWLSYVRDSLKIEGAEKIYNDYRVDSVAYYDLDLTKKYPMLIRKKQNK